MLDLQVVAVMFCVRAGRGHGQLFYRVRLPNTGPTDAVLYILPVNSSQVLLRVGQAFSFGQWRGDVVFV